MNEGLVLRHAKTGSKVFLVHGHQVDCLNDTLWWFSRFIVRNFCKLLQLGGAKDLVLGPYGYCESYQSLMIWDKEHKRRTAQKEDHPHIILDRAFFKKN